MKEEEKIFAGKIFNASADELRKIKHAAHAACQQYNALDESDPQRAALIQNMLGRIGTPFRFQGPIQFNYGKHTFIGNCFMANFNFLVMDDGLIFIGNNVACGPNVSLLATNHPLLAQERLGLNEIGKATAFAEYANEIHIEDNVWLAAGVSVLGGVHIGANAVIGAGSVVTRDIPANTLAAGTPCRVIRTLTDCDSCRDLFLPEDAARYRYNLKK
ncbi:MAG: sugar O-acetyltransferase [Megasphaera sp.]|jgi:acetyltransferase-like isoleucine patch superfamily enzyme|nr:sugar O-acetyltransferase [Megasphaera sp.]